MGGRMFRDAPKLIIITVTYFHILSFLIPLFTNSNFNSNCIEFIVVINLTKPYARFNFNQHTAQKLL